MTTYIALLRAVNVGGTGKLPMAKLVELCAEAGFPGARTYIASGNVIFSSTASEKSVREALATRLSDYAGKRMDVLVRSAAEIAGLVAANPFPAAPGNRVVALITDNELPGEPLDGATGRMDEELRLGRRALYIFYHGNMADSRLRLPCARNGTARNFNTLAKLAALSTEKYWH
jgi:uncharacterized protein (DUF1697 family)